MYQFFFLSLWFSSLSSVVLLYCIYCVNLKLNLSLLLFCLTCHVHVCLISIILYQAVFIF